jgi:hypothetical protein
VARAERWEWPGERGKRPGPPGEKERGQGGEVAWIDRLEFYFFQNYFPFVLKLVRNMFWKHIKITKFYFENNFYLFCSFSFRVLLNEKERMVSL